MKQTLKHTDFMPMLLSKLLGGLFICSSLLKILSIKSFKDVVRLFLTAYFPSFLLGYTQVLSVVICLFELIIGLCALVFSRRKVLSVLFVTTMSFFTCLTGINLYFPSFMGCIESCGCFGELIHFTPLASFIKCVILWIMSLAWFCFEFLKQ